MCSWTVSLCNKIIFCEISFTTITGIFGFYFITNLSILFTQKFHLKYFLLVCCSLNPFHHIHLAQEIRYSLFFSKSNLKKKKSEFTQNKPKFVLIKSVSVTHNEIPKMIKAIIENVNVIFMQNFLINSINEVNMERH